MTAPYTIVFVPLAQWTHPKRGVASNEQSPTIKIEVIRLTLNLLRTTIVAPRSHASKWQMGFTLAFKELMSTIINNLYTFPYAHSTEVSRSTVQYEFILFVSGVAFTVKAPHFRNTQSFRVSFFHTLAPSFIHST